MTGAALDATGVLALRLRAQALAAPRFRSPEALLAWMGPLQAQDRPASLRALALRLAPRADADVEAAVARKAVVRHWLPRGTLHWCAAQDLDWLRELLAPRLQRRSRTRLRQLELDEAQLARSQAALARALRGGSVLSRPEALDVVERAGVSTAGQRGYHILQQAGLAGVLAFGPMRGKQPGFIAWTRPKGALRLRPEAAASRLARLYFQSRGPAGLEDFVWWSGLAPAEARAAMESLGPSLRRAAVDGRELRWLGPAKAPRLPRRAWLLPAFDEWLIAYARRSETLEPRHAGRVVPGANGLFHPIVVADGRVRGTWRRDPKGAAAVLKPFGRLPPAEQAALTSALRREP